MTSPYSFGTVGKSRTAGAVLGSARFVSAGEGEEVEKRKRNARGNQARFPARDPRNVGEILRPKNPPLFSPGSFISSPVEETRPVRSKLSDPTLRVLCAFGHCFFPAQKSRGAATNFGGEFTTNSISEARKISSRMKDGIKWPEARQTRPIRAEFRRGNARPFSVDPGISFPLYSR